MNVNSVNIKFDLVEQLSPISYIEERLSPTSPDWKHQQACRRNMISFFRDDKMSQFKSEIIKQIDKAIEVETFRQNKYIITYKEICLIIDNEFIFGNWFNENDIETTNVIKKSIYQYYYSKSDICESVDSS